MVDILKKTKQQTDEQITFLQKAIESKQEADINPSDITNSIEELYGINTYGQILKDAINITNRPIKRDNKKEVQVGKPDRFYKNISKKVKELLYTLNISSPSADYLLL